jgi:4-amino-4-deoxychorismate lyase
MTSLTIFDASDCSGLSADTLPAVLSDRGLAYGHGVFETMLCVGGRVPLKRRHVDRMKYGAERLGIPVLVEDINSAIDSVTAGYSGIVKIILTAGSGGAGYENPQEFTPRLIISKNRLPQDIDKQRQLGVKLWRCQQHLSANEALAGIKHLNRLEQVLARNEIHSDLYSDGIMCDSFGNVIETTSANIFLKLPSTGWVTPNLKCCGVAGVMRSLLLDDIFPDATIRCDLDSIDQVKLEKSCEIFICNSVRGIVPVIGVMERDDIMRTLPIGRDTLLLKNILNTRFPVAS